MNIVESGPSPTARLLTNVTRKTVRTALQVGCRAPWLSWPYGAVEYLAGLVPTGLGANRTTIHLADATAELISATGVPLHTNRIVLYMHGGGFLACGPNTHNSLITRLSKASNAPVLAVKYRLIPHSLGAAIEDCLSAYYYLRSHYDADQIVLAGDSAGGYLAMSVATHCNETPAAMVLLSPLLQLDPTGKKDHPNMRCDAMFGPGAFDALSFLISRANGGITYEPLEDLTDNLPPTLIHVSGHEVLLHDTRLAQQRLEALGVPVDVVVWPGQIHVFQIASVVPEARRSIAQIGQFIINATSSEKTSQMKLTHRTATVG